MSRTVISLIEAEYRRYKGLGEGALEQLDAQELLVDAEGVNSIATIVWHIAGNLASRFTDFLETDGEKAWRDRESEFERRLKTPAEVRAKWEEGWGVVVDTLEQLTDEDLSSTITIRGVPLRVDEGLLRSLAHTSYHVGQIVHIAKGLRASSWKYLTIPPGGSDAYNADPTLEKAAGHAQALERPQSTFPRNTTGAVMKGLMMNRQLLISSLIEHGAKVYHDREIVSRTVEGPIHRYTLADLHGRSKQLAGALTALGVKAGDRIATLAWNGYRHVELYFGVSGMEAVCHTLNPRLHPSELIYILNHAEDRYLFTDLTFLPLVEAIAEQLKTVEGIVVMTDADHMPESKLSDLLCYEDLLSVQKDDFVWPDFDENTASSLCYTSGTTGHPKGVLYSHRSSVLHGFCVSLSGVLALSESETFLPVVPMFHVNAWGTPYAIPMTGTKLVMPGPALDGASLTELMREEGVTCTAGVPTVWSGLLDYWRENHTSVPTLKIMIIGGSAVPRSMVEAFDKEFGVEVRQGWGMTEMSPIGSVNMLKPEQRAAPAAERYDIQIRQGRAVYGVEMKIVDAEGNTLPCDGEASGELKVRGPWVISGYYRDEEHEAVDSEGWFATGDVATIDSDGYMQITDRMKDLIKSGGEWISSIELENLAMSHPDVMQAAVIGIPDEKWSERPLLIVKPKTGANPSKEDLLGFFKGKVADWSIPDDVVMVEELPIGGTGKVQKSELRKTYA